MTQLHQRKNNWKLDLARIDIGDSPKQPEGRKTTEIYTHVAESDLTKVRSPLDFMDADLHLKGI